MRAPTWEDIARAEQRERVRLQGALARAQSTVYRLTLENTRLQAKLAELEAPPKPTPATCAYAGCSNLFAAAHGNQRYCSPRCRRRAAAVRRGQGTQRACASCGQIFTVGTAHRRYCSDACFEDTHKRSRASTKAKKHTP